MTQVYCLRLWRQKSRCWQQSPFSFQGPQGICFLAVFSLYWLPLPRGRWLFPPAPGRGPWSFASGVPPPSFLQRSLPPPSLKRTGALVCNYDFPRNVEECGHGIGGMGRAGRPGMAVTLLPPEMTGSSLANQLICWKEPIRVSQRIPGQWPRDNKANRWKKEMEREKLGKPQEIVSLMSMPKSDTRLLTGDFKIFCRYTV